MVGLMGWPFSGTDKKVSPRGGPVPEPNTEEPPPPQHSPRGGLFRSLFMKRYERGMSTHNLDIADGPEVNNNLKEPAEATAPTIADINKAEEVMKLILHYFPDLGTAYIEACSTLNTDKITRLEVNTCIRIKILQEQTQQNTTMDRVPTASGTLARYREAHGMMLSDNFFEEWKSLAALLTRNQHTEENINRRISRDQWLKLPEAIQRERALQALQDELRIVPSTFKTLSLRMLCAVPALKMQLGPRQCAKRVTHGLEHLHFTEPRALANALFWERVPEKTAAMRKEMDATESMPLGRGEDKAMGVRRYTSLLDQACDEEAMIDNRLETLDLVLRGWSVIRETVLCVEHEAPATPKYEESLPMVRQTSKNRATTTAGKLTVTAKPPTAPHPERKGAKRTAVSPSTGVKKKVKELTCHDRLLIYTRMLWTAWHPRAVLLMMGIGADRLEVREFSRLVEGAWQMFDCLEAVHFLHGDVGIGRLLVTLRQLRPEHFTPLDPEEEMDEHILTRFTEVLKALQHLEALTHNNSNIAYCAALYGGVFFLEMADHWVDQTISLVRDPVLREQANRMQVQKMKVSSEKIIDTILPHADDICGIELGKVSSFRCPSPGGNRERRRRSLSSLSSMRSGRLIGNY